MPERYANYIGGTWSAPDCGDYLPDTNPADFAAPPIAEFPNSGEADMLRAVSAAEAADRDWANLPGPDRGEFVRKAADVLERRVDTVAHDLMREEGKSLPEARGETLRAVTILRYYSGQALQPDGETFPSATATTFLYTRRCPLGVCGLITPWNFPCAIPVWKAAPALVFGNTVVLKPSEHTPLTAWHIAQAFAEVGLPAGVFNVVFGEGARVGGTLLEARAVAAVSFTGSVRTGHEIAARAASTGKKYQLEMGGKNAVIVLGDANIEQAVRLTVQGAFRSAGQKCTSTSRAVIAGEIYDEFVPRLVAATRELRIGPGDDPQAYLGPVITADARERILAYVEGAIADGARVLCGGSARTSGGLEKGYYVSPTILDDVRPGTRIAQEEVFGPVLCVMRAEDLDHAIALVNDVDYGLSASIFTRDLDAALTFSERTHAGTIRVNGETAGVEPQAPFGGMKASSSYSREQGLAARDFFTQTKTVSMDRAAGAA